MNRSRTLALAAASAWVLVGPAAQAQAPGPSQTAASTGLEPAAEAAARAERAAALAAARAATDRRDFATALPLFDRLVERAPADADLLIEAARVHGWADQHIRATALYRHALAAAPQRRGDIIPSLAWQTLWAGRDADALVLFEEAVRLAPADRALGWGYATALNAAGQHRRAIAQFERWAPPTNESERLEWARALRWAGFEDRAWALLQAQASAAPGAPGAPARASPSAAAGSVLEPTRADSDSPWPRHWRSARDVSPYLYASRERTEDRDRLATQTIALGAGWQLGAGVNGELGARRVNLDEPASSARAGHIEAAARMRLGEPTAPGGTWWPQLVLRSHSIHAPGTPTWQPTTATWRLKWVPADGWRADAEHTREFIETPRALANRVRVDVSSLGADWRRDQRLLLAGSLARLRFDDGTARQRFSGRAEWALWLRPRLTLGAEANAFERTSEGAPGSDARGYWNPRRYEEMRVVAGLVWEQRPWELRARAGLARSREVDGAGNGSRGAPHLWELALTADAAPGWQWRASFGGSGQGLGLGSAGSSGARYWRRWAQVGLSAWFL